MVDPLVSFDWTILSARDQEIMTALVGSINRQPDLTIAPHGVPYLYRWYVVPKDDDRGQVYFHVQVASDPDRPLHDHPWDNTSVILSGGYIEIVRTVGFWQTSYHMTRHKGDVIFREAALSHRLILPDGVPYTMSLFTTGPVIRDWGFWTTRKTWINAEEFLNK